MVGFFLQIVIVSLCSLVLLMRMAQDRKQALKRGKGSTQEEERLFQNDAIMEEDGIVQRLYRDNDDDLHV